MLMLSQLFNTRLHVLQQLVGMHWHDAESMKQSIFQCS